MIRSPSAGSDSELFAAPITEPDRYEFQSYLSDDEDVILPSTEPADDFDEPSAVESPQTLPEDIDMDQNTGAAEDDEEDEEEYRASASEDDSAPSVANGHGGGDEGGGDSDSDSEPVVARPRRGPRKVKIEVALPRLSRRKRQSYELMEVESYEPSPVPARPPVFSPRRLRKRTKVSVLSFVMVEPARVQRGHAFYQVA